MMGALLRRMTFCDIIIAQVRGFHMLLPLERALFERHNITLLEVPWMLPPGLTEWAGGCAMKDLIRLHVRHGTR